jgi:hypothetical protein
MFLFGTAARRDSVLHAMSCGGANATTSCRPGASRAQQENIQSQNPHINATYKHLLQIET